MEDSLPGCQEGLPTDYAESPADSADEFSDGRKPVRFQLEKLKELDRVSDRVQLKHFVEAIGDLLHKESRRVGRFQDGAVHLVPLTAARGVRFPVVFAPEMVEKAFPVIPSQDPILLDDERRALNESGEGRLPIKADRSWEEKLLFNLLRQSAETLYLTFPRNEESGQRPRAVSHFVLETLARQSGKPYCEASELTQSDACSRLPLLPWHPEWRERALSLPSFRLASLMGVEPKEQKDLREHLMRDFEQLNLSIQFYRQRWKNRELTYCDGIVDAGDFFEGRVYSPTRLEAYAKCPYQFLLAKVFNLESYEAPDDREQISALDKGGMLHSVYEEFYKWCKDSKMLPLKNTDYPVLMKRLLSIASGCFQEQEEKGLTGRRFFWELDKETMRLDLYGFLQKELEEEFYVPDRFEGRFGFDDDRFEIALDRGLPADNAEPPADSANLGSGSREKKVLRLCGYIDRIDRAGSRYRVLDYKTGSDWVKKHNSLQKGQALQLPLYLMAAEHLLGVDLESIDAEYFYCTRKGSYRRTTFTGAVLEERKEEFLELLRVIVSGIENGNFFPAPGNHCRYCDFNRVCDRRVGAILERKQSAPELIPFSRLEEMV
jgi:ATP-dependent helicase/nuclease subunit B